MSISVREFAGQAEVAAGRAGLRRVVRCPQIVVPDLESPESLRRTASSVVHLLPSQLRHLRSLARADRLRISRAIMEKGPACVLVSGGMIISELLAAAERFRIPLVKSRDVPRLADHLMKKLDTSVSLHGVLVQIFELGVLILGESAVGKSEAALDLVLRGHKLVADDMVVVEKTEEGVMGRAMEMGADLLQIRGLGVINIRALYGESAMVNTCRIGLVVELEEWQKGHRYSLVGLKERRYRLLGANIPFLRLPVKTGRNMATLIEVAARNQILKNRGIFTARELNKKLRKRLAG